MIGEQSRLVLTQDIDIEERYQSIPNATAPVYCACYTKRNVPYMEEPTRSDTRG